MLTQVFGQLVGNLLKGSDMQEQSQHPTGGRDCSQFGPLLTREDLSLLER